VANGVSISAGTAVLIDGQSGTHTVTVITGTGSTLSSSNQGGVEILGTHTNLALFNAGSISGTTIGAAAQGNITGFNSGSISGTIGIEAGAAGSNFINAGVVTGTGVTAILFTGTGNTLTLQNGTNITGIVVGGTNATLQLGGTSGSPSFNVAGIGAQYLNFSTFNKIDPGVWTLTGTNAAVMPWTVAGDTLNVDATMANSTFTVNSGVLGGNGTVGNTQINAGGTLAPGNGTPGTFLTVSGNLAFQSGALYLVQINSAAATFSNVTGTAALAGTVQVTSPTSSFRFNSPYTILTSAGLGGTQFNALTTPTGIAGSLIYSGNNVLLNLTNLGQLPGLNTNQHNVATVLDAAFNVPGGQTGALGTIFAGNIPQNLTQASGETATGSQQTTFNAMSQFLGTLFDHLIGGGTPTSTPGATPYAEEGDSASAYAADGKRRSKSERDAYGMITKAAPRNDLFDPRWSVWTAGFGGSQTTDGNVALGSNSTTSSLGGIAAGADYLLSPRTVASFALAGGATSFSVANGGSGRSDLFQAGAFIKHVVGQAYISGALAYSWQDITTDRTVTIAGVDRLHAEFNANAFSGRVEGGYRFVAPWMGVGITPYAAGQFTTFDLPAYAEQALSGASTFALAYASKSVTDSRSELGVRTDKSFAMQDSILTLRGRAAWAHDYNPDRSIGATFQSLPGASFVVNGAAQGLRAHHRLCRSEMAQRLGRRSHL
jgi:uncharacterized protein with beta-barrel porin domain